MRRIFVPLHGPDDAGTLLRLAGSFASRFGAQVEAALITERAGPEEAEALAVSEAVATRAIFEQWAAEPAADASPAPPRWREISDGVVYASASLGRASDLIVTRSLGRVAEDRVRHLGSAERGFRDALLSSGRLTLLAPAQLVQKGRFDVSALLEQVVLAWDGSAGAAHALGQSLALIACAASVRVVIIGQNTVGMHAREAIGSYVGLHNETARLIVQENAHRQTGRALLDAMAQSRASLVVMGVCGRSHPSGAGGALGGTIRKVIEDGSTPILTAG